MAENFFAQFEDGNAGLTQDVPQTEPANFFSVFDSEPDAVEIVTPKPSEPVTPSAPQFEQIPGVSWTDQAYETLQNEAIERKRSEKESLDRQRGVGFLDAIDGMTDSQQYVEFFKGIAPGAIRMEASVLEGVAGWQTAFSSSVQGRTLKQLEILGQIERGEETKFNPALDRNLARFSRMSPEERLDNKEELVAYRERLLDVLSRNLNVTPVEARTLYQRAQEMKEYAKGVFPADPEYRESVGRQLGEGVGSLVSGLPVAWLGPIPATVFFGMAGSGESLDRAIAFDKNEKKEGRPGLTQDQILTATIWGVGPGMTDVLPVEVLLGRLKIPAPFTRIFARAIGRIGGQTFIEGIQEGGQAFLQNLIAEQIYNDQQSLSEGVLPEAGLGAGVGAIAETTRQLIRSFAGRRRGPATQEEELADLKEIAKAIDETQRVARETKEDRLDIAEPPVEAAPAAPVVPEATTAEAPEAPSVEQPEAIVTPSDIRVGTPVNIVTADDRTVITPEPTVIREIVDDPEHGTYVFVEGTETGFPIEQIQPIETSPQETALRNVLQGISDEISDAEIRQIAAGDRAALTKFVQRGLNDEQVTQVRQLIAEQSPQVASQLDDVIARSRFPDEARIADEAQKFIPDIAKVVEDVQAQPERSQQIIQAALTSLSEKYGLKADTDSVLSSIMDLAISQDVNPNRLALSVTSRIVSRLRDAGLQVPDIVIPEGVAQPEQQVLRQSFVNIMSSSVPKSKWASELGISDARLAPLVEEAIRKGFLIRDKNGNVRRVPRSQRSGSFAAMAVPDNLPETMPGEGDVALTPEAEEVWPEAKAAVNRTASAILPAAVKVDVVDNIAIAALKREDQMLALREEAAFRAWFGDSKVVDENGEPLVVYHGTKADIESFQPGIDGGIHFGTSDQANMREPSGNITPVYLRAEKLKRTKDSEGSWKKTIARAKRDGKDGIVYLNRYEGIPREEFQAAFDKGITQEQMDSMPDSRFRKMFPSARDSYIVFDPTQIKSAIGNRGTFDPTDPRISYALRKTKPSESAIDEDAFENGVDIGREGVETGEGQPAPGRTSIEGEGVQAPASDDLGTGLRDRALARIIRQESASLDADGNIIAGRPSRSAKTAAKGREGVAIQRVGKSESFSITGFDGRVRAEKLNERDTREGNLARLTYEIFEPGTMKTSPVPLGGMEITQRADGAWEVGYVEVYAPRNGIGTKLYDAIEADLGIRMSPSGVLSESGHAFWQKRSPASVQWHVKTPTFTDEIGQMYFSPRKISDELDRIGREIKRLDSGVGTAMRIPKAVRDEQVSKLKKERGQLIALYGKLPLEARAAKDQMFSLRGFYSPAIRAAENISQDKGTGEQFLKQISKSPGVRQDELEWMGLKEFLKGKKSITRDEVLTFMKAHLVQLDEKILGQEGDAADIERVLSDVTAEEVKNSAKYAEAWLGDADKLWSFQVNDQQFYIASFEDGNRSTVNLFDDQGTDIGEASTLEDAQHMAVGFHLEDNEIGTKFHGDKVPGGENYREILIRLPELGVRSLTPEEISELADIDRRLDAVDDVGYIQRVGEVETDEDRAISQLHARRQELISKGATPRYESPHFRDQEIVHLRVDDRTGPNGEKVLFINEVQSDLHQKGRKVGYINPQAKNVEETRDRLGFEWKKSLKVKLAFLSPEKVRLRKLDVQYNRNGAKGNEEHVITQITNRMLGNRAPEWTDAAIDDIKQIPELFDAFSEHAEAFRQKDALPNAPFKGDLWLELALKRALLYAAEGGYDAVSWARSDQIAKAVGGDAEALSVQYDQKINRFLNKYTKKWGGKVEGGSDLVEGEGPFQSKQKRNRLRNLEMQIRDRQDRLDRISMELDQEAYRGTVETLTTQLQTLEAQAAELRAEIKGGNPLLRITPEMRSSVMEGQPLALRGGQQQQPQALGQTDPYNMSISIAMRAVEAEAKAKGVSTEQEAARVLRHEAVEFFKAMGLFTEKEWNVLKTAAKRNGWVETTGVRDAYQSVYKGGMSETELNDLLIKEAIAEQYSEFHLNRKQFKGVVSKVFQRIKDFIDRVGNFMRGEGFQTWNDVFESIDQGEFKARFEEAFPEMVAQQDTEAVAPMTLPGVSPEAPLAPKPPGPTPGLRPSAPGSLIDIQRNLRKKLGLIVKRGRLDNELKRISALAGTKLQGQYSRQTGVIRLAVLESIDTEAHEVAHALEDHYPLDRLKSAHEGTLVGIAQMSGNETSSEGFAEFFRLYLTNPQAAEAHAPQFLRDFEAQMQAVDPETLADIQEIRGQYQNWRNASSSGRLISAMKSGVPESTWSTIRKEYNEGGIVAIGGMYWRYLERVYQGRFDKTNSIRKLMMRIARQAERNNQEVDLSAWRNPQMQAQKIGSADAAGTIDIMKGVHWENSAGKGAVSLKEALSQAFNGNSYEEWSDAQRDAFGAYLIGRRGRWLWQRFEMDPARNRGRMANTPEFVTDGDWYYDTMKRQRRVMLNGRWENELLHAPDKHNRGDHEQTVADLETANPQFADAADMIYQFLRDLALKRYQAGLDALEEYQYKTNTPDYVPWFRDMSDEIFKGTPISGQKVAQKFKIRGSYRDFINPIEGIVRQVYDTNHEIAVNKPKLLLAQMAEEVTGAGQFAEIIPATRMKVQEVKIRDALINAARKEGLPPEDAKQMISTVAAMIGDDAVAKLFSQEQAGEGRDAIVHYMDNGQLKMLQIHDDGYGIARDILGFFETVRGTPFGDSFFNMLVSAVRVPQRGITAHPGFLWRNLIRDTFNAAVMQSGYFPIVSNIRTVASNIARRNRGEETWGDIIARHGGIMGGLNRTNIQQLRQGRTSELRADGVVLQPWRRDFWARTMNPFNEDFWKWAEWSEANARQTLARIAFNRALKDAQQRYPNMPPEQQTFVALESAVQQSRDYTDYGRMGDFPSQVVMNRLIMFLNPALQGPDKMIRKLFLAQTPDGRFAAAQAVRKQIAPLFNRDTPTKPLAKSEKDALKDALRAWTTVAMIAITHLMIELLFNDDDELEDKSEMERALNVPMTINGQPYRIPRGFDVVNVASNAVRATYDSWKKEDPTAWQRFRETLGYSLVPPHSSPLLDMYIGWKHGRNNFFDSAIEPEYMKGLLPGERYRAYTSKLSRDIADGVNSISPTEVSPLMVEYTLNTIGSDWARDILRTYDVFDPDKPALRWQEYPFIRTTRGLRGTRGSEDFWDLMGREGEFMQPAGSYKREAVDDKVWSKEEIRKFFEQRVADDDAKAFSVLNGHYDIRQRRLHPMLRAREFITGLSATARAVASNRIEDPKTEERVEVSRAVRGQANEIIAEISRRESLNALIALQRPGYEFREPQPVQPYMDELEMISPDIYKMLIDKITNKSGPRVYDYDTVREVWPEVRRLLLDRGKIENIIEETGQVEFNDLTGPASRARVGGIRR